MTTAPFADPRTSVAVRDATADDLPAIAAIYTHYVLNTTITFNTEVRTPREWIDRFQRWVVDGPYDLLVATADGQVVGYIETQPFRPKPAYARSVEISVYVAPDATGAGIGRELFTAMLARLDASAFHRAYSVIALPNDPSIAIHERFGFVHRGTLTDAGHKLGRYLDVAFYERDLDHPPSAPPSPSSTAPAAAAADHRDGTRGGVRVSGTPAPGPPPEQSVFERAGGLDAFVTLVERFYARVERDPLLRPMYPDDLEPGKRNLALFLAQYWGGGDLYSASRGHPRLRMRHAPFPISPEAALRWAELMTAAIRDLHFASDVEHDLLTYVAQATPTLVNRLPEEVAEGLDRSGRGDGLPGSGPPAPEGT